MAYFTETQSYMMVDLDTSVYFNPTIFFSPPVSSNHQFCCDNHCGMLVPFAANGNYNDPNGGGRNVVHFNRANSATCGIPFKRILRGDLEGLVERDDLAELNPNADSIRLKIEVSDIPFVIIPPKS